MADPVRKAKAVRVSKLGAFTRKKNHLTQLLEGGARSVKLKEVYGDLTDAFKDLEIAQENLLIELPEDGLETELAYLDAPAAVLSDLDLRVSTSEQTEEQSRIQQQTEANEATKKQEFEVAKAALKAKIEGFGKPSVNLISLSNEKKISFGDMRSEIKKLEESLAKLMEERVKLGNMDPTADLSSFRDMFNNLVVVEIDTCKRVAMEYLKDDITAVPIVSEVSPTGGSGSGFTFSSTKRETVMLPKFSGDERTAFLKYPIWRKQWSEHIQEYEEKYRATMLMTHLDDKAQLQIVGLETEYDAAIKQLDSYYVDAKKVIKACLDEIKSSPVVAQFDYKGLVAYKKILVNNHARLKASNLEHEMSNTAVMGVLLRKFPIHEAVEWQKFLSEQDKTE